MNKIIINTVKVLQKLSPALAGKLAFSLFCRTRPTPMRQLESSMMDKAKKGFLYFKGLKIRTYTWGGGHKPILLIHGWDSRTSRFYLFIKELLKNGFQPMAYDAPGHGESQGKTTSIIEANEIIQELYQNHGPFESIIAHSLGVLNAFYSVKNGIKTRSIIAISGVSEFKYLTFKYATDIGLNKKTHDELNKRLEYYFYPRDNIWSDFSAHVDAEKLNANCLIIHDKNDEAVTPNQSILLHSAYKDRANLLLTNGLGHLRILSDHEVIRQSIHYLKMQ